MKNKFFRTFSIAIGFLTVANLSSISEAAMSPQGQMIAVAEYTQAEKLVKAEKFSEAEPLLLETLRQHPTHANALNLLGYVSRRMGKFDIAEQYYEGALTVNPNHRGALNYMGQLFIQTGRSDKAKGLLEHLKSVCKDGCEEADHLQKAVDTGVAGNY